MKFAFSTNAYTNGKWTLEDAMERIADAGYQGVEILADEPLLWVPTLGAEKLRRIKRSLNRTGLAVSTVNGFTCSGFFGKRKAPPGQDFGPSWADDDPAFRKYKVDYTKKVVDFAAEVGTANVSVGAGYPPKGANRKVAWERLRDGLEKAVAHAEKRGVSVNMEYEPFLLIDSRSKAKKMLEEIPSPSFGLNFDIGHAYVCGEDVAKSATKLYSKIRNFHVEDIPHDDKGKPFHYHVVPGDGKMPLMDIFSAIEKLGWRGFYTVELYTMSKKPVWATRTALKRLRGIERALRAA